MVKKIALTLCTALVAGSMAMAQNRTVTGKVTDADGSPIIGATVKVEGSKNVGAVTAGDGQFSISVPANSKLNITYIGYKAPDCTGEEPYQSCYCHRGRP